MHARPAVISGSPDVVAALIDKNTVVDNGMVHEPVSIVLPSLQNITSVSVSWDGLNQFNANWTAFLPNFEQRSGHESEVWQGVFVSTLHLSDLV